MLLVLQASARAAHLRLRMAATAWAANQADASARERGAGGHPLDGTIAAFEQLVEAGKIRAWGVSNFDEEQLDEALRLAGRGRLACDQVLYHLEERAVEHAVLPFCEAEGIAMVAYSPFGSGRFPRPGSRGGRVLGEIAAAHGVSPRAVALAFLLRGRVVFVIPKASRPAHVADNAAAGDLELAPGEIRRLDEAFPRGPRPRELPTL